MKFGVFHLIWAMPLADMPALAARARSVGADVLEIAISQDPPAFDIAAARRALAAEGLEGTLITSLNADRDITADDPNTRRNGRDFLKRYVEYAAELGSPLLSGGLYGTVFTPRYLTPEDRALRWGYTVEALAEVGPVAQTAGVRIAIEPLSRFETSLVNTAEQGRKLVDDAGHPAIGLLLDTFQMNIEEKSLRTAIATAGDRLFHVHAAESDRGTPGTGLVHWTDLRDGLRETGYDGRLIIESFNPDIPDLANFIKLWRRLERDQDTLARSGLQFLRGLFE
jgi:D-psicose/D-tagatose/L-ribulose 3-epimerase